MNYSFYCKNCGHSFVSDDKNAVANERREHRIRDIRNHVPYRYCPLVPTNEKKHLYARPGLAQIILERQTAGV